MSFIRVGLEVVGNGSAARWGSSQEGGRGHPRSISQQAPKWQIVTQKFYTLFFVFVFVFCVVLDLNDVPCEKG